MATFKAEVYAHQRRTDGTYNIKIRVTHKTKKKYLSTQWYVGKDDLTRSLKLKNQHYIDMVENLIRQYRQKCNEAGASLDEMDVAQVVELITKKNVDEKFELDFVAYANRLIEQIDSAGRDGTAHIKKNAVRSLTKFAGKKSIDIFEITPHFLRSWLDWLSTQHHNGNCKGMVSAQAIYFANLRMIYNRAKKEFNDEFAGVVNIPFSPFNSIDAPKMPQTRKRAISVEQIRALARLPYKNRENSAYNIAKDVFLLSFMLLGMNMADMYNATDYRDGRITYCRKKTRTRRADGAEISVKVEPEAVALIEKYRDTSGNRIFNFYKRYSGCAYMACVVNKALKQIGNDIGVDDLEFYAARHSWATIAVNDAEVDKYSVHSALNHADATMNITDVYIRKSYAINDRANRKVLDLLNLDLSGIQ